MSSKGSRGSNATRLLLVDHSPAERASLSLSLTGRGYDVEVVATAAEALEKINRAHFDLVLLDQMMPGTSGLDLLRLLRATYSQSDLPVIMVTPADHEHSAVEALGEGANDHVCEPFNRPVVAARIQAQLDRSRAERSLQSLDPLTSLYNRRGFVAGTRAALLRRGTGADGGAGAGVAVVMINLDGFKMLNESIGPAAADRILIETADRLRDTLPRGTLVARTGDAEFAVCMEAAKASAAEIVAREFLARLHHPFKVLEERGWGQGDSQLRLPLTASVGIAIAKGPAEPAEMLRDAALAMSRAREEGRGRKSGWKIFEPEMRRDAQLRMAVAMDLRHALERNQLTVFYQPKVHLSTRTITGFEALIRWQHPEHGWIPPNDFIPLAEETGLIIPVGAWILRRACHQLKCWQAKFPCHPPLSMNVNLSVKQLADPDLIPGLRRILKETGIPPNSLKLELTESTLASEMESAREALSEIQDLQVGLKLDDFGTGYSSLSYLRSLPFDSLKIDRSFINRLVTDAESSAIIVAILNLAHTLHMSVVAEGIETEEQAVKLLELGCEVGQGFLFSKPVPAEAAERLILAAAA